MDKSGVVSGVDERERERYWEDDAHAETNEDQQHVDLRVLFIFCHTASHPQGQTESGDRIARVSGEHCNV